VDAPEPRGLLDRAVAWLARALDAVGLNGARLQWRWSQRRRDAVESAEQLLRSARGKHKMCPACRALVPRRARSCSECGERLGGVPAPGWGRVAGQLLPGALSSTALVLVVNLALFLMMLATPPAAVAPRGLRISFDYTTLMRFGGGRGYQVLHDGEWWRIVTSIFVHGGVLHMALNSLALLRIGRLAEDLFGSERMWAIYLGSGLCGSLLSQTLGPHSVVVGASGATCGLVGLLLAYSLRRRDAGGNALRGAMTEQVLYIVAFSLLPGISLLSHAGGLAGGFLASLLAGAGPSASKLGSLAWQLAALAGVVLVLLAFYNVALHGQDFVKYL
jgi:rhomboid protease GluP